MGFERFLIIAKSVFIKSSPLSELSCCAWNGFCQSQDLTLPSPSSTLVAPIASNTNTISPARKQVAPTFLNSNTISANANEVNILDTPGLADTGGTDMDNEHRAAMPSTIKKDLEVIGAVIILENGTLPRLGTATEYDLTTTWISNSIAGNIAFSRPLTKRSWRRWTTFLDKLQDSADEQHLLSKLLFNPATLGDNCSESVKRRYNEAKSEVDSIAFMMGGVQKIEELFRAL
ncbi:hypothetical protein J3R30DRAFT_3718145 [Lentinula aciculospora]|uniref:G domain-containing protein n=1 Tax=Lentinula aciculospora TaxID=153920 RepID=A0A9W8ZUL9_9AGAR|nr:hypothetical protein J3R30DRAFT_3718145 [Lentinula aciculospora]